MSDFHFVVERPGIHTTFQDSGYEHLQHFGITTGGVIDNNLFKIVLPFDAPKNEFDKEPAFLNRGISLQPTNLKRLFNNLYKGFNISKLTSK